MLPPAALTVADGLLEAMMTVIRAVAARARAGARRHTQAGHAAELLFRRLSDLILALIRISAFGPRAPRAPIPGAPAPRPALSPAVRPARTAPILRRPGWLLDDLPDIAPTLAAELARFLGDPALATLLDAAPTLNRTLRPLLRGLGLTIPTAPITPPPSATPPTALTPPPDPAPPSHQTAPDGQPVKTPSRRAFFCDQFIPI